MSLSQRRRRLVGRLRNRKTRVREGQVLVEGVRAVGEALAAGAEVAFACVSPRLNDVGGGPGLVEALHGAGVEVVSLGDDELVRLADTEHPQGVLLVCREPVSDVRALEAGGRYLVLDAIQDPGNVGTLIRAAVAFDLDAVLVLDGTADPWSPKAVRASAGLLFRLPIHCLEAEPAVELVLTAGIDLLVAAAEGTDIRQVSPAGGWALAVGNEGAGVRDELRSACRHTVAVRMPGPAESLNAGIAGAILLHALSGAPTVEKRHA
jgi:TrmH family RNA methyltransferase